MNVLLRKVLHGLESRFYVTHFLLSLLGLGLTDAWAQTSPPSLSASSARTCGSPISVTATCQSGATATFVGSGGSASGNVYTFTAPGSYTLSATCTGSGGTSAAATPVSVSIFPPTAPPTLTPSSATVAQGGTPVTIVPSGCTGGYISYFGANGVNRDGSITVPTGTTGIITISAICTLNNCRSDASVAYVTVTPSSTPVPTPVVSNPIPPQTGTVGSTFTYLIPTNTFTDPNNDPLTLTASGLPAGFFFNGLILTGPLTASGTSQITITATNLRGGSAQTTFQLTAVPGPSTGGPLQLLAPTYDPCTRAITFNTTGGDGTPITFTAIGVQRANAQSPSGVVEQDVVTDNKTLTISATQSGATVSINFTPPTCTQPPTSTTAVGGPIRLLTPTYDPCTRVIVINTTGGDGTPITYTAIGVQRSSPQSNTGVVELGVVLDGKVLTISATQGNTTVSGTFAPPACSTGGPLQLLTPSYDPCTRAITFNTKGGDGTPISFTAIGVQRANAQSPSGVVEAAVVADNKTLTITASQSGTTVSINFAPPACTQPPTSTTAVGPLVMLAPTYDPCTRVIIINTSGGDGTPITYTAIGVQRSSPQSNTGVVELGVVLDNKSLNLVATQSGQSVSTSFAPPRCSSNRSAEELGREKGLSIVVMGNPPNGNEIVVDVVGAEQQPLQVRLINPQGQPVMERKIQSASAVERVVLPLRSSAKGVYLIQAISNGRSTATKVLHQ